jgi:hypothetical protein
MSIAIIIANLILDHRHPEGDGFFGVGESGKPEHHADVIRLYPSRRPVGGGSPRRLTPRLG